MNIDATLAEHDAAVHSLRGLSNELSAAAELIKKTLAAAGRVFICGNGGSAADAQHFAAELTGRFENERPGLAAIALSTDTSAITSIGNDYGFDKIFARQLQALGRAGDVLVAISTSGNSANVLAAVDYARGQGIACIALLGRDGGRIKALADVAIVIPVTRTARIQEAHIVALHVLCEAVDA